MPNRCGRLIAPGCTSKWSGLAPVGSTSKPAIRKSPAETSKYRGADGNRQDLAHIASGRMGEHRNAVQRLPWASGPLDDVDLGGQDGVLEERAHRLCMIRRRGPYDQRGLVGRSIPEHPAFRRRGLGGGVSPGAAALTN